MGLLQLPGPALGKLRRKLAAAHRLRDHDWSVALLQDLMLLPSGSIDPIEVVQLDLREVPLPQVRELLQHLGNGMRAEPDAADAPLLRLLRKVFYAAAFHDLVSAHVHDAMDKVEVDVVRAELAQLLLEHGLVVRTGHEERLRGQMAAIPAMLRKRLAEEGLGLAVAAGTGRAVVLMPLPVT